MRKQLLRNAVLRALWGARKKAEKDGGSFQLVHFGIEDDHLHRVVEAKSARDLANGVRALEIRIARALNGALARRGNVFPDRYHRRDLGTPTEVRNVLAYVLDNARKHVRHLGDRVAYVDASTSGASFDGWSEPVTRYRGLDEPETWSLVRARTWLLREGWRRRGLISPYALPGARKRGAS